MNASKTSQLTIAAATLLFGWGALWLAGCATSGEKPDGTGIAQVSTAAPAASFVGGAQLWADTCGRCHNLRSPSSYSAAQWEVITHHMRVRCTLTGDDERAIVAFLKAASGQSETPR
jgi:hypothetical protein